ncbi:Trypsin-1 [Trachymyrmex zeteki]|uniref:chymotrypsin n=2 Tax=Mycetomoellerius zeteki TaxID=64791 RepID=A0A151WPR3_9HYME|nr:Trypsin-1 [Trachymyrmex zeteki]
MKLLPTVIGGRLAKPGEIPYQVSLQEIINEHHFCGGVIINEYYVVTAAHCMYRRNISDISVNAGTTDLRKPHSVHLIEFAYIHKKYNPQQSNYPIYDIALLKLETPFVFSFLISSVKLPEQDQIVEADSLALISGYGWITTDGKKSKQLHIVDNIITNQTYCNEVWNSLISDIQIQDSQICAIHPTAEKGACFGDSGGPLTVNGYLIGLVSFGYDCASTEYPTVYTRIPSFIDWIYEHIRINEIW